jgi:hypothetical protein
MKKNVDRRMFDNFDELGRWVLRHLLEFPHRHHKHFELTSPFMRRVQQCLDQGRYAIVATRDNGFEVEPGVPFLGIEDVVHVRTGLRKVRNLYAARRSRFYQRPIGAPSYMRGDIGYGTHRHIKDADLIKVYGRGVGPLPDAVPLDLRLGLGQYR